MAAPSTSTPSLTTCQTPPTCQILPQVEAQMSGSNIDTDNDDPQSRQRSIGDIDAELEHVLSLRQILYKARFAQLSAADRTPQPAPPSDTGPEVHCAENSHEQLDRVYDYLKALEAERQIDKKLLDLDEERRVLLKPHKVGLEEKMEAYSELCTGLAVVGGIGYTTTLSLVFSAVRGQMELTRWACLFFALGFVPSALIKTTMQFPYIRKHFPVIFGPLLPFFILWMCMHEVLAFVFLYVALVSLDLRPELFSGRAPVLDSYPFISAKGNLIPGYVIVGGILVIGYPWFVVAWLWSGEKFKRLWRWLLS